MCDAAPPRAARYGCYTNAVNWVDAAIVGIVVVYALTGLRRGFLLGIAEVVTLSVGFVVALALFRPIGTFLAAARDWRPGITQGVVFVVMWALIEILLGIVVRAWHRRLPESIVKSGANRIWGVLPAAGKGIVAAALFAGLLSQAQTGTAAQDLAASKVGSRLVPPVIWLVEGAYGTFGDAIREIQEVYGPTGEVTGTKKLGYTTTDGSPDPDAEARMLEMVNSERVRRHLQPLVPDVALREVARKHSADMFAHGYFAHDAPGGATPFDRVHSAGIRFREAGENIAQAMTVETAHDRLMRSKGHRDNILDTDFHKVGIGAIHSKTHGTMFTQDFTN